MVDSGGEKMGLSLPAYFPKEEVVVAHMGYAKLGRWGP